MIQNRAALLAHFANLAAVPSAQVANIINQVKSSDPALASQLRLFLSVRPHAPLK